MSNAHVERLQSLISSVPGVVWEAWGEPDTAAQRIDFVSDHVTRMLGYTVEEWLATPNFWLTIVHPDDREQAAQNAAAHFGAGGTRTNEFRWMTKDGRAIWVEAQSTVIADADGRPIGMRGVTMDISARKRAEESLRFLARAGEVLASSLDYETTLKTVMQLAVPMLADFAMIDLLDDLGTVRRLAAFHADPAKQPIVDGLLPYPPLAGGPSAMAAALETRKPVVADVDDAVMARNARDGNHQALMRQLAPRSFMTVPMTVRNRPLGTLTFLSEVPARYGDAEVELATLLARRVAIAIDNAQLYRTAVDASAAKDEFLATISHELRTPMTATLGWVRMLSLGQLDEAMQKLALESIDRSTRAQAKLIDDILDVSSIILGKFRIEPERVHLRALIDQTIAALQPASEAKSIAVEVSGDGGVMLQGDGARLQQVVWNLVSNAIKFGRRGGRIDVEMRETGGLVRLVVRDDGTGIDAAFLPHVFDRFRQAESGMSRSHGGLGLGLAIVRHLVELHGGVVRAESEGLGKGATFTVELPVAQPMVMPSEPTQAPRFAEP